MRHAPEVFFLPIDGERGQRLCVHHRPQGPAALGAIVYVHPFAEEMNKSRRMAALQARAFARAGYAVLQIDLLGCGDSSGDFGDATWADWVGDVVAAATWMQHRYAQPLWLWGLRAGCLLACEAAQRIDPPCNLLLWQPPATRKLLLQQFLRLKLAGDMLGGQAKGAMDKLRAQLAAGEAVEIAGYSLAPALASGLESAILAAPPVHGQIAWLELSTREDAALLPASERVIEQWQRAGHELTTHVVQGPAFWQTSEIEESPALIDATLAALTETVAA